jgi:WD40 repeat protein/serine/threonine protein kinase
MSEIPTADWSWINSAAERFERAWKNGERPRIEEFLIKVPETQWPALLQELMRVESELRRRAGETPSADEYRQRFPEHESVVTAVFEPGRAASATVDEAESAGSTRATSASSPSDSPLPPELANHPDYEILGELGHGGMGVVYLAHNRILGRDEVLKVMDQQFVEVPGLLDRFQREIRAVAKLRHPNIVSAYTAFRCGRHLVFAMEYAEGLDLRRMVKAKGPMPVGHACNFVRQAALGLQHAHEAGMVHRDIKPANLMLSRQKDRALIKILDFGLSKAASEQNASELGIGVRDVPMDFGEHLTITGAMLGTPDFIAPEQIDDSQKADIRADIYSLGCTLYFLLSGRPPFQSDSMRETLMAQRSIEAPLLNQVRQDVPAELAAVVAKMMAKEPDRRFQTPGEVANVLAPFFKKQAAAAEAGDGMWSSLIDLRETEDDAGTGANEVDSARERPQWLWPAITAGVLVCGLIGAWAAGLFNVMADRHSLLVKNDGTETTSGNVGVATEEKKPIGSRRDPVVASKRMKTSPPLAQPAVATRAPTPSPDASTPAAEFPKIAREPSRPVAEPAPGSKASTPRSNATTPAQLFHEIASIPTSDPVIQARLLPDGRHVRYETGGKNRALWRGDLTDPKNPHTLKLEVNAPSDWSRLVLSSDGRFAVLAGNDKALWHWDLQTGQSHPLRTGRRDVTAIGISPDNQLIAYVRGGMIQFCDAFADARGKKKGLDPKIGSGTELIAFSPDGRQIVSTHADQSIRIWDVKTGRQIGYAAPGKLATGLAVFPDGRRVLISFSGPTFVWDLATNQQTRQAPGFGTSIAVSADGRRALIGGGNLMQIWEMETGEELMRQHHKSAIRHVAFSSDDHHAVSSADEGVRIWALPPGRTLGEQPAVVEVAQFPAQETILSGVVVSPDGRRVLTVKWPSTIRLWDREARQLIHTLEAGGKEIRSVAFWPDGNLALSGGDDKVVRLWNLVSGEHRDFPGHVDNIMSVALSPDGKLAYSAGGADIREGRRWDHDGTDFDVRVWNVETGEPLRPLKGHTGIVWSLAVSADGRLLLSGGNDAVPILWNARTGREKHRLRGHTARVECVAFLPDSKRALSSGLDGTIRLWDVETGREVRGHFKEPTGGSGCLAVSPDGHRLFSADGVVRYWNLDTGEQIQRLRLAAYPTKGSFTPDGRHVIWGDWAGMLRTYRLMDIPDRPIPQPRRSPGTRKRPGTSPKTPAHNNPSKAVQKSGKPEEAIAEPRAATQPKPDDASAHNDLGKALYEQGKLAEAIVEYQKAIELKPDDALAHNRLGRALQDQGSSQTRSSNTRRRSSSSPTTSQASATSVSRYRSRVGSQRPSSSTRRRSA